MKKILIVLLLLMQGITYAQNSIIEQTKWVADDLDFLSLREGKASYCLDGRFRDWGTYLIKKDTIIFVKEYQLSSEGSSKNHVEYSKFLITQVDPTSLTIAPINSNAKKIAKQAAYKFTNLKYCTDHSIKFKGLAFDNSFCSSLFNCVSLSLNIDKSGTYHFTISNYDENKPLKKVFTGQLSQGKLDTLYYLLQHSLLKNMLAAPPHDQVSDMPEYRLTVYYNDKKLSFVTSFVPINMEDLYLFLCNLFKKDTSITEAINAILK